MRKASCEHLEAYLALTTDVVSEPPNTVYIEDMDRIRLEDIDQYMMGFVPHVSEEQFNDFIQNLMAYGLDEHEISLVLERYINNATWAEICESEGWTSVANARKYLQRAVDKLKLKGFKPRGELQ